MKKIVSREAPIDNPRRETRESFEELFSRHVDLAPLRGRRRGLVRCPFHQDRTASLSVDLDRGIFHCFGCLKQGGRRRFAELIGASVEPAHRGRRSWESELQKARRELSGRQQRWIKEHHEWISPLFQIADFIRRSMRTADQTRAGATTLGPEHPRVWDLLELAARVERDALVAETEFDSILCSGRIA